MAKSEENTQDTPARTDDLKDALIGRMTDDISSLLEKTWGANIPVDVTRLRSFVSDKLWPYVRAIVLHATEQERLPADSVVKRVRRHRKACLDSYLENRIQEEAGYRKMVKKEGRTRILLAELIEREIPIDLPLPLLVDLRDVELIGSSAMDLVMEAFRKDVLPSDKEKRTDGIWSGISVMTLFAECPERDAYEDMCMAICADVTSMFEGTNKRKRQESLRKEVRRLESMYDQMPEEMRESIESARKSDQWDFHLYDVHERKHDLQYLHGQPFAHSSSHLRDLYGESLLERQIETDRRAKKGEPPLSSRCRDSAFGIGSKVRQSMEEHLCGKLNTPASGLNHDLLTEYVQAEYGRHIDALACYAHGLVVLPPPPRLDQPKTTVAWDDPAKLVDSLSKTGMPVVRGRKPNASVRDIERDGAKAVWKALRRQLDLCSVSFLREEFSTGDPAGKWRKSFDWNEETEHRIDHVMDELVDVAVRRHRLPVALPWRPAGIRLLRKRMRKFLKNAYMPEIGFVLAYASGSLLSYANEKAREGLEEPSEASLSKARRKAIRQLIPSQGGKRPEVLDGMVLDEPYPWSTEHALSDTCASISGRIREGLPASPFDASEHGHENAMLSLLAEDIAFIDTTMEVITTGRVPSGEPKKKKKKRTPFSVIERAYARTYDQMVSKRFSRLNMEDLTEAYVSGKRHLRESVSSVRRLEPTRKAPMYAKEYVMVRYNGSEPEVEFRACVRRRRWAEEK